MRSIWFSVLVFGLIAATTNGEDNRLNEIDPVEEAGKVTKAKKEATEYKSGDIDDRGRLINALLNGYDKRNYPTNMTIQFGLAVLSIDVNEKRNTFEADVWLRMKWNDKRLQWDKKDYDVGVLRMAADAVWVPDTTLYNSASLPELMKCHSTNTIIYPTGDVLWVPPCRLVAHCDLTLWKDPLGPQKCYFKFGSWTFDGLSMGLDFYDNKKMADLSDLWKQTSHWDVVENEAVREEKFYDCCVEPYVSLTYNITVQRKQTPKTVCKL